MTEEGISIQACTARQELETTEGDVRVILEGLGTDILKHLGDVELGRSIRVFARDPAGRVVGGATGDMFGGWVYISLLWVDESLRNRGYGTALLDRIEREAARLGCGHAHLDTYSFEARPFYERHGYEVFGILEDYPPGHRKYFLKKRLAGRVSHRAGEDT